MWRALVVSVVAGVGLLAAPNLDAQTARLDRLDPASQAAVTALVDSARAAGLPTEPLVQRALQGAARNAPPPSIVSAVRALAGELNTSRQALGAGASEPELVAAAAALRAGTSAASLSRLRAARRNAPLTVPLATIADLVSAGVPADTAFQAIYSLASRGGGDDAMLALRADVLRDISAGASPAAAATVRARGASVAPSPSRTGGNPGRGSGPPAAGPGKGPPAGVPAGRPEGRGPPEGKGPPAGKGPPPGKGGGSRP